MSTTAEKIAALEEALANGELTVESDGERITYQSFSDLAKRIDYFRRQLASEQAGASGVRPKTTVAVYDPS